MWTFKKDRFLALNESALINSGFTRVLKRNWWISTERRMAFTHQVVRERSPQWLRENLQQSVPDTDFVFHFLRIKDLQVCVQFLKEIGLPNLRPYVRIVSFRQRPADEEQ